MRLRARVRERYKRERGGEGCVDTHTHEDTRTHEDRLFIIPYSQRAPAGAEAQDDGKEDDNEDGDREDPAPATQTQHQVKR